MKRINDFIKEGLKITSKTKVNDKLDNDVKDIYSFADKYDCKIALKYLLEPSEICIKAFDYILLHHFNGTSWYLWFDKINKYIESKYKDDKFFYVIGKQWLHGPSLYIRCLNKDASILGNITITTDNKTKYIIQESLDDLTSHQVEIMYKILDYIIQTRL